MHVDFPGWMGTSVAVESQEGLKQQAPRWRRRGTDVSKVESQEGLKQQAPRWRRRGTDVSKVESQEGLKHLRELLLLSLWSPPR